MCVLLLCVLHTPNVYLFGTAIRTTSFKLFFILVTTLFTIGVIRDCHFINTT